MQAADLHCPSCGAAVSTHSPQCKYCKALLKTVACPKCLGMMFLGTKFCEHCGTRAEKIVTEKSATGDCPRCKGRLRQNAVADITLESCDLCSGTWIGIKAFDQICNDQVARTAASGFKPAMGKITENKVKYIHCPQCQNLMNRINYAGGSGVIIDVCRNHGIWLDKDELRHIIDFIQSGGVDRQRKKETDTLQQEREKLSRERSSDAERMSPISTFPASSDADLVSGAIEFILGILTSWFRHH